MTVQHNERRANCSNRRQAELEGLKRKEAVRQTETEARKAKLDLLPTHLRRIMEAAAPLEETIGKAETELIPEGSAASLLPGPLYVLFANLAAYRDTGDVALRVDVCVCV
jgi:THO complex subunit 5